MRPGKAIATKTDTTASEPMDRLDRHALVMAIWTPPTFIAAMLLRLGIFSGVGWWIAAGFALIIVTFVGHIIVNVVLKTTFTAGETALGGVVFAVALLSLLISRLLFTDLLQPVFMMLVLGLASLIVTLIVYLLIAFGPRQAFEKFDVIRDNNLRPASILQKGWRR